MDAHLNSVLSLVTVNTMLVLVFLGLATFLLNGWYNRRHLVKCIGKIPGSEVASIIYYFKVLRSIYTSEIKAAVTLLNMTCGLCWVANESRICKIWLLFRPFVYFFKPETCEILLSSHTTIDKSIEYSLLHPWIGTGLLTSSGEKWHKRRKMLTSSFHFRILEDFVPIFHEQSMVLVRKLLKEATQKPYLDIAPLMTLCTLDIICETAMGVQMNAQSGEADDYVKAVSETEAAFIYRALRPWMWLNWMFYCFPTGWKFRENLRHLHGFTKKVIKEKKEFLLKKKGVDSTTIDSDNNICSVKKKKVFLELLLEHHFQDESFTEEDIREEVDTFMFEGHETTAMALSWTLYSVGLLPEVQENLIREIDSIFGDDVERPVTCDDLRHMKYTECVIKEALRLYPSVPMIGRELKEDIQVLDYTVPSGTLCLIVPLMLHRNPEVFPNPEKFDPERFFPENCVGRHPYAYIPFSAGPRNCIGQKFALMEEKTVIANIFRHMKVQSLDPRDRVNLLADIILRNADPIRLKITPRVREKIH